MRSGQVAALLFAIATLAAPLTARTQALPDEPAATASRPVRPASTPARYADALKAWTTPEDVAAFLGASFRYDRARALALAESPASTPRPRIHDADTMFRDPTGVCVDLARFGVETLNGIDERYAARYVMIEFEPVTVAGHTLRRHWVAAFERDGRVHVFADSWRPGHVAGPYATLADYIADYASVRARPIVRWEERAGFARRTRTPRSG